MKAFMQTKKQTCDMHGEYEAIHLPIGEGRWTGCPVCAKERQAASEEMAMEQWVKDRTKARAEYALRVAQVPMRMGNASFDSFRIELGDGPDAQQVVDRMLDARRTVNQFAQKVATSTSGGQCLVMIGKPGTGKTHLACSTIRYVAERGGCASRYVSIDEIVSRVYATYGSNNDQNEHEVISEFSSVALLVIDEIGSSQQSDARSRILFSIMNNRYNDCLPTILIGNVDFAEIKSMFGDRLFDRLMEIGKSVVFDWKSHRGMK